MIRRLLLVACLAGLASTTFAAPQSTPATSASVSSTNTAYDAAFDAIQRRYALPGLAVGVIEDGRVVWQRTAGELEVGSGQPIMPTSVFKIASNSKAMTGALLARLVDQGKLRWDDPVVKHLPGFAMFDPWVTRQMQVGDLLVHNSGLPLGGGDLMLWPEPNHFTRADILAGLRHIRPAYSFRSGYAYDNTLYVVAGEVAAAAGGDSYENLLRRELFEPLGLSRCVVGAFDPATLGEVAQPHGRVGGRWQVVNRDPDQVPETTMAAAGGVRCSLQDMLRWAGWWLAPEPAQAGWLSAKQREEAMAPRTMMPISRQRREWDRSHVYAYGYGWRMADVDGQWVVSHTGTLNGMYSALVLLPDARSGFVMLANGEAGEARTLLVQALTKHFIAPAEGLGVDGYAARLEAASTGDSTRAMPDTSARRPARAQALAARIGIWRDPWFGDAMLCPDARGRVRFESAKSPLMRGVLMQVGSRQLIAWDVPERVDVEAWVVFEGEGSDTRMRLSKVDPRGDFSFDYEDLAFARVGACPAR